MAACASLARKGSAQGYLPGARLAALSLSWRGSSRILLCMYLFGCLGSSLHKRDLLLSRTDSSCEARVPELTGSVVEAHGLSCLDACGVLVP